MSDKISKIKEVAESSAYRKLSEWIEESAKLKQENHILRAEINRLNQTIAETTMKLKGAIDEN